MQKNMIVPAGTMILASAISAMAAKPLNDYSFIRAEALAKKYNRPVLNSEMACVCRGNPYDVALEICERHKMGWYVFQLMISGGWANVHGLVYPDGTVRDPSIIAAIYGWHRNRDLNTSVKENPNREGHVQKALDQVKTALAGGTGGQRPSPDDILDAAEFCANLLEAAQMVPMHEPPTPRSNSGVRKARRNGTKAPFASSPRNWARS